MSDYHKALRLYAKDNSMTIACARSDPTFRSAWNNVKAEKKARIKELKKKAKKLGGARPLPKVRGRKIPIEPKPESPKPKPAPKKIVPKYQRKREEPAPEQKPMPTKPTSKPVPKLLKKRKEFITIPKASIKRKPAKSRMDLIQNAIDTYKGAPPNEIMLNEVELSVPSARSSMESSARSSRSSSESGISLSSRSSKGKLDVGKFLKENIDNFTGNVEDYYLLTSEMFSIYYDSQPSSKSLKNIYGDFINILMKYSKTAKNQYAFYIRKLLEYIINEVDIDYSNGEFSITYNKPNEEGKREVFKQDVYEENYDDESSVRESTESGLSSARSSIESSARSSSESGISLGSRSSRSSSRFSSDISLEGQINDIDDPFVIQKLMFEAEEEMANGDNSFKNQYRFAVRRLKELRENDFRNTLDEDWEQFGLRSSRDSVGSRSSRGSFGSRDSFASAIETRKLRSYSLSSDELSLEPLDQIRDRMNSQISMDGFFEQNARRLMDESLGRTRSSSASYNSSSLLSDTDQSISDTERSLYSEARLSLESLEEDEESEFYRELIEAGVIRPSSLYDYQYAGVKKPYYLGDIPLSVPKGKKYRRSSALENILESDVSLDVPDKPIQEKSLIPFNELFEALPTLISANGLDDIYSLWVAPKNDFFGRVFNYLFNSVRFREYRSLAMNERNEPVIWTGDNWKVFTGGIEGVLRILIEVIENITFENESDYYSNIWTEKIEPLLNQPAGRSAFLRGLEVAMKSAGNRAGVNVKGQKI